MYKVPIIIVIVMAGFIIWSFADMVCKPCVIPPSADPANYYCPTVCHPEPRWYGWLR